MKVPLFHLKMLLIYWNIQRKWKPRKITYIFHSALVPNCFCFCVLCLKKSLVFSSMIFYTNAAEPILKLRSSLLVSVEKRKKCNQERQMNSFCLILIPFEHRVSRCDYNTSFTGDVFPLEEAVKNSWAFRWLLIKQKSVGQPL